MIKEPLEDEMIITDENGEEKVMQILFTYENEERHKTYVFLTEKGNEEDAMAFIYDETDKSLSEIEDDEEYGEVEEVFNAFLNDPKIKEAKK